MVWFECCGGIHKTLPCKLCIFVFLLCLNTADVIADWLLYIGFKSVEKGLVYGPLSNSLLYAYLAFAVIGSILLSLEVINAGMKTFWDKPVVNMDTFSAVSLWCGDLPQITINVVVTACREELVSDFQIAKGAVVISGCFIRLLIVLIRYCSKKHLKEVTENSPQSRPRVAVRAFVVIGVILTCIGSILVFIFANFNLEGDKLTPHNPNLHFQDVGIFADREIFFLGNDLSKKTWVQLTDIQTVRNSSKVLLFKYTIENGNNQSVISLGNNLYSENVQITNCYRVDTTADVEITTELPVSSCANSNSTNSSDILFRLRFQEPINSLLSNPRIFGDIIFSWNGASGETGKENPLRYFGYKSDLANDSQLIFRESSLTDVRDVWRTGYMKCETTGNTAPTLTDRPEFSNN